ncbi:NADPH-ferrihemoprotein reductase [Rhizoctonia solani]|uniref:NADPH-ferrihemoprotein reductase n=1 Tax=Rhizoctonia solani TaxID=456999 RepID=A0A0K6FLZ0_9AGAM|nr:NADPH-ferrihemoprotein reductase [Rhizoctonia solani]
MTTPIPQPPSLPFIGNVRDIDTELPTQSFALLAKQYGEIYRLNIGQRSFLYPQFEVLDETRFHKKLGTALMEVRNLVSDGLFTAHHGESNWGIAHRILMPAFGPLSIRGVFDDMLDVVSQLVLKWERFGPSHEIDPTDDFTRMAFEMIALCTFNYRLNTFYTENEPPFVKPMGDFLKESFLRIRRPRILQTLLYGSNAKYAADMEIMNTLAERIIEDRKNNPSSKKDLLNAMLLSKDPQTGQGLSEENIKAQMLTFLIAGHETTSGMLSFAMAHIMRNPEVYAKIRHEVDQVLGKEPIKFEHLSKLSYINALLRETLRATPILPQITVTPYKDEVIGNGRYLTKAGAIVLVLTGELGKDPSVWGEDVENFDPERMLDGKFEAMPPKAWLPFGSGVRACIGRLFAWQEALIALATIFQKFDFTPADPLYSLQIKQTLTVKPNNFKFRAIPRQGAPSFLGVTSLTPAVNKPLTERPALGSGSNKNLPLYVTYGSNTGSCEAFAQSLAASADAKGFRAVVGTLDSVANYLPNDGPVIIITASFEEVKVRLLGAPSDRAATLRYTSSGLGQVIENKLLTTFGAPAKHHIEIQLPADVTYRAGDYSSILPLNPPEYVRRCLARFNLSPEQQVILDISDPTTLPAGKAMSISELLSGFIELGQAATKRNIFTLIEHAQSQHTRSDLETLLTDYDLVESTPPTNSMLDLIEKYRDIDLPLGIFIASLPIMRLRQYSISSSPLWNPSRVTLTFGVVAQGKFLGVASNYLAGLRRGDRVQVLVRPSSKAFHPPMDPGVPMMMFAAGSGIAPFRGFMQERAMQKKAGRDVAKSVLFFGCRTPEEDYLYADELSEWQTLGVVDVRPAFSRGSEDSGGKQYVQNRVWTDRELVRSYDKRNAKFYTCGRSYLAAAIRAVCIRIVAEEHDGDEQLAEDLFRNGQLERFATDIFG